MRMLGFAGAYAVLAVATLAATPATAQFFFKSKDMRGERVTGDESGIGQPLPGATPAELRASVVWNMRAALNVAALQCQFEPALLTVPNYNAILKDHGDELASSYDALNKYFIRVGKSKPAGQKAIDQFGTRTYSSFTTVAAQYGFCSTASAIGRDAVFTPRGSFAEFALVRMREMRNSLMPWGEQQFPRLHQLPATLPRFEKQCWSGNNFNTRKCGDPLITYSYAAG